MSPPPTGETPPPAVTENGARDPRELTGRSDTKSQPAEGQPLFGIGIEGIKIDEEFSGDLSNALQKLFMRRMSVLSRCRDPDEFERLLCFPWPEAWKPVARFWRDEAESAKRRDQLLGEMQDSLNDYWVNFYRHQAEEVPCITSLEDSLHRALYAYTLFSKPATPAQNV